MKYLEIKNKIINDKYTEYVYEAFDIQDKEETCVKIPINFSECKTFDWNIGVIYGGSGTGKTTLLKQFGNLIDDTFDANKALISNFDWLSPKDASSLLSSMGLSSVPTWLRPFGLLSNGEQYRARLAYKVGKARENEVILIDEFTSVVDRDVAKAMSNAIQKYIRRENKKIILASCHFDIMEWLLPDWTYSPLKGRVERHDYRRQSRPQIELSIFRCRYETWNIFKQYHYLTSELSKSAKCFLTMYNDKPIAFNAVLPLPSGTLKNAYRMSRTVVLPDYQGMGIGGIISDYIASLYVKDGKRFYAKTSNPALWNKRENSKKWRVCDIQDNLEKIIIENQKGGQQRKVSITKSFEYIGNTSDINDEELKIIRFDADVFKDIEQNQLSLF
jgi:energy-coupling factor transporter ATP-binding protein EcfA2